MQAIAKQSSHVWPAWHLGLNKLQPVLHVVNDDHTLGTADEGQLGCQYSHCNSMSSSLVSEAKWHVASTLQLVVTLVAHAFEVVKVISSVRQECFVQTASIPKAGLVTPNEVHSKLKRKRLSMGSSSSQQRTDDGCKRFKLADMDDGIQVNTHKDRLAATAIRTGCSQIGIQG